MRNTTMMQDTDTTFEERLGRELLALHAQYFTGGGSGRGPRRVRLGRYQPRVTRVLSAAASVAVVAGGAGLATAFVGGGGAHLYAAREVMVTPVKLGKGPVHIRLADFSVDTQADGTVLFTVGKYAGPLDPSALRQALAEAGVPALVTIGTQCQSADQSLPGPAIFPPPPVLPRGAVFNPTPSPTPVPAGPFVRPKPGTPMEWYVAPSAIPAGAEVSFGFTRSLDAMFTGLVTIGQTATCSTTFDRLAPYVDLGPVPGLSLQSLPSALTTTTATSSAGSTSSSPATTTASSGV
jgi:hypothetical protein